MELRGEVSFTVLALVFTAGCASSQGAMRDPVEEGASAAITEANAHPDDMALQIRAVKLKNETTVDAARAASWLTPLEPVLARVDRPGASCDELQLVASSYLKLMFFTAAHPPIQRSVEIWKQCPSLSLTQGSPAVAAYKRLQACEQFVEMARTVWPQAKPGLQQSQFLASIEDCSTSSNRLIHLSVFLPPGDLLAYEQWRQRRDREDLQVALRDAQRGIAQSCTANCGSLFGRDGSCVRACSGADCTACNRSLDSCLSGCPASP